MTHPEFPVYSILTSKDRSTGSDDLSVADPLTSIAIATLKGYTHEQVAVKTLREKTDGRTQGRDGGVVEADHDEGG